MSSAEKLRDDIAKLLREAQAEMTPDVFRGAVMATTSSMILTTAKHFGAQAAATTVRVANEELRGR